MNVQNLRPKSEKDDIFWLSLLAASVGTERLILRTCRGPPSVQLAHGFEEVGQQGKKGKYFALMQMFMDNPPPDEFDVCPFGIQNIVLY